MFVFKFIREPLFQFLILGACIYGAYALFGADDAANDDYVIVVDEARVEGFATAWNSRMGRLPSQKELDGLVNQYIREEILYREAKAMGLGADDPITRRRMAQKLEFLTKDIARLKEPEAGELEQYFADNQDDYRPPDLITFTQVFFDPDKRDETTLVDAEAALMELQAQGEPGEDINDYGDRFMLQSYYPQKSELDIRRQLGAGFSEPVMQLEPGRWHGPILSGYGVHLVYVHALQPGQQPEFAEVQARVREDWMEVQQQQFNEEFFESLKSRYEIDLRTQQQESTESAVRDDSASADPAS